MTQIKQEALRVVNEEKIVSVNTQKHSGRRLYTVIRVRISEGIQAGETERTYWLIIWLYIVELHFVS